jgi:hypothetical protein
LIDIMNVRQRLTFQVQEGPPLREEELEAIARAIADQILRRLRNKNGGATFPAEVNHD